MSFLRGNGVKIAAVLVVRGEVLDGGGVFLLEKLRVKSRQRIVRGVVLPIFRDLVNEEQRQNFYAAPVKLRLALKVRLNRLANLYAPKIFLRHVADRLPDENFNAVQKFKPPVRAVNVRHDKISVVVHFARQLEQIISDGNFSGDSFSRALAAVIDCDCRRRIAA